MSTPVNVGIDPKDHAALKQFADERGLKMRAVPSILWRGWQLLTPKQQAAVIAAGVKGLPQRERAA